MPTATISPGTNNGVVRLANGIALIEIQGALNKGSTPLVSSDTDLRRESQTDDVLSTDIGEIELEDEAENGSPATMIVGGQQLMRGKVVRLATPLALLELPSDLTEHCEINTLEVVTHKIVFNQRPEPYIPSSP